MGRARRRLHAAADGDALGARAVADEMVAINPRASGFLPTETFTLGPYEVTRVHRGGISSSGRSSTLGRYSSGSSNSKTFYDFDLKAPEGLYEGHTTAARSADHLSACTAAGT